MVIEDKALMDAIESIQQHLSVMNIIRPIMLALSTVIGFILSYLLTRNRLHEFAIMRSLGTKRLGVYSAFFLEQLLLFLLGVLPVLIALILNPTWIAYFGWSLVSFILLYALGIVIAIYLMGRSKVLDILFTKE
jgi:ABC-type antimicrobial peptide transport system permease subunit